MQRIKPGKNQLAERIVAASQNAFRPPAPQQFPGVPDGVRAGSAGVGDDGDRAAKAEGIGQIQRLPLGLVMNHPGGLPSMPVRCTDGLAIIVFSQAHSAAGCAEYDGKMINPARVGRLRWDVWPAWRAGLTGGTNCVPARAVPGFIRSEQQKFSRPVKSLKPAAAQECNRQGRGQINFAGDSDALPRGVEHTDRSDRHATGAEPFRIFTPACTESSDNARAADHHARWQVGRLFWWEEHGVRLIRAEILANLSAPSQTLPRFSSVEE